jgi:hypothetical protein
MQVALLRAMAAFDKGMTFAKKETIEEAKDRLDYLSSRHSLCARNNNKQRFKFCCSTSRMFKTFASTSTDVAGDSLRGSGTAGGAENDDGDDDDDDEELLRSINAASTRRFGTARPLTTGWSCRHAPSTRAHSRSTARRGKKCSGCPSATAS